MQTVSKISLLASLVMIEIAIYVQIDLYQGFKVAVGETKAMYGINYMMKLPFAFIGGFALLLSIISILKEEKVKIVAITFGLAIFSIILIMVDLWNWF